MEKNLIEQLTYTTIGGSLLLSMSGFTLPTVSTLGLGLGGVVVWQLTLLVTLTLYSKHNPAFEATGGPYSTVTASSHVLVHFASCFSVTPGIEPSDDAGE